MNPIHRCAALFTVALMVCGLVTGCGPQPQEASRQSLEVIFDQTGFATFQLPELDFLESCFGLEEVLQRKLVEMDIPDGMHIAKDLRVLLAAGRAGQSGLPRSEGAVSLREVLTSFATAWEVIVLVEGNTLIIAEPFDEERFPHALTIKARPKPQPSPPQGGRP